jgi:hypothetical protein
MVNLETGQSKCFDFVKLSSLPEAQATIHGLIGRQISAKPKNIRVCDIVMPEFPYALEHEERVTAHGSLQFLPVADIIQKTLHLTDWKTTILSPRVWDYHAFGLKQSPIPLPRHNPFPAAIHRR